MRCRFEPALLGGKMIPSVLDITYFLFTYVFRRHHYILFSQLYHQEYFLFS